MAFDYTIILKDERGKHLSFVSIFLCCISIGFSFLLVQSGSRGFFTVISLVLTGTGLLWNLYANWKKKGNLPYNLLILFAGLAWFSSLKLSWIGILFMLLALLERKSRRPVTVQFNAGSILYASFFERVFLWKDLNNALIKDGMLTLDFKNNKLIQKNIFDHQVDEALFNQYCRKHLQQ